MHSLGFSRRRLSETDEHKDPGESFDPYKNTFQSGNSHSQSTQFVDSSNAFIAVESGAQATLDRATY